MALLVLLFLSILLATFGLVIAMTRPSAQEKTIDAADGIDPPYRRRTRPATAPESRAIVQGDEHAAGLAGWMKSWNLTHSCRRSQKRIFQAGSSTDGCHSDSEQSGFVPCRICNRVAVRAHGSDRHRRPA